MQLLVGLIKYLKGYVKIRIEGYSPERFFNLCNVHGILLWGVEKKQTSFEMFVYVKDYKKMRPLVRKTRTKIILLEKHGLPFFLYKFRKRRMFFVGMIFCVICIYTLSLFVWNIHFDGNVTQNNAELLSYLHEIGVAHGVRKKNVICEEIETKLRSRYPNILWISAEMRGTRIIIQIEENTDKDIISQIEEKNEEPVSIVADCDGVVESIIVRQGTSQVLEGAEVTEGQTLVEGYYEIKNDAGEIIRYEGVVADADIVIASKENYSDKFSAEYVMKQYTKRKKLGVALKIFNKTYDFIPYISYKNFDTLKKHLEIHVTENFYLPFHVEFIWYQEYIPKRIPYTKKEIKNVAKKRFINKYENNLQKGVQIIEKDVKINTNGKLCHVTGTVKLLIPVTKKVPVDIPEIRNNASLEGEH